MQLQLDLDDRPRVRFVYPNVPGLTSVTGRLVEIRGLYAFVYFEVVGVQMCCVTSLETEGGNDEREVEE